MGIGAVFPPEWLTRSDQQAGRRVRQFTAARANSYPLYYFGPSVTDDERYLVFHSERSGSVQLFRMDLNEGSIAQLTDGMTKDSGWAVWCEYRLNGIYNHLSALDSARGIVYYFDNDALWSVDVASCVHERVASLAGRVPIGQSSFSPDGRHFAFIDSNSDVFIEAVERREKLVNMRQFSPQDRELWRQTVPCRINVVDTSTSSVTTVVEVDYHVHHVLFLDDSTLVINHARDGNGMWTVSLDGANEKQLRPADGHGRVCHQVVTEKGLLYEAYGTTDDGRPAVWFGRYQTEADTWTEHLLPDHVGYVHTGNDPAGEFLFIESAGADHVLYQVHPHDKRAAILDKDAAVLTMLRQLATLPPGYRGQRYHAHPFLSPARQQLFFTEIIDGYSQICSLDVSDLTSGR